jgi:hypothetical protein
MHDTTTKRLRVETPRLVAFLLLTLALALPAGAQVAVPRTPLAGVSGPAMNYPDGSRLRMRYVEFKGGVKLPGARAGMTAQAFGLAAATESQSRLPAGFTLKAGDTFRIEGDARAARRGTAAGAAARPAAPAKYITLHAVEYRGIPLARGSDYLTVVTEDGRLLAARQRGLPATVDATSPSVTRDQAIDTAKQHAEPAFVEGATTISQTALEFWVDGDQGYLAWVLTIESDSLTTPMGRRYWISAVGQPRVLNWESIVYHTHFGTVTGTEWPASPFQPTASRPLAAINVVRSGGGGGTVVTGDDGRYAFPSGSGTANLSVTLGGPNSVVQNLAGPVMSVAMSGGTASPLDANFGAATEFEFAQVTAFYGTNAAHQLARDILAPADLPNLPTRVNISSNCNAFWNGSSINFFRAGSGCPNTAYADVVFHEYGHGVDARKGGILDGGYSEGFGDAMAILGTRQSCVGRDFFGSGTCLRLATDVILWPPAPGEGVHAIGRRYAGFTWELVQQLKQTYGEENAFDLATRLVLVAALANPSSIPDAVHLSFVADDTDGDLTTCSPHFKELAAAADSRSIPRPADCAAEAGTAPGAAGHFSWAPAKKVSANSNILQVSIHLDQPAELHLTANSSARTTAAPLTFRTGLYNQPAVNVMWTYSYRTVTVQHPNQWVNFSSMIAVSLPAGDHTIYWKIWVTGGELELSAGTLLVEAFTPAGTPIAAALGPAERALTAAEPTEVVAEDEAGQSVTRIAP